MLRPIIVGTALLSTALWGYCQDQKDANAAASSSPKVRTAASRNAEVRKLLANPVEILDDFRNSDHPLPFLLKFICDTHSARGKDCTILLDHGAFKRVAPDEILDEMQVRLSFSEQKPALKDVLEMCIRQMGTPAALLIRNGRIEIVPEKLSRVSELLDQRIIGDLQDVPFKEAVEELGAISGVTIFVDPRCVDLKRKVSLTANSGVSLRGILATWADNFDCKLVIDESRVLMMPRADYLRKLSDEAEELHLQSMILKARGIERKSSK